MRIISGKARGTILYTLNGNNTRPTLDRVKESLFNIIQSKVKNAIVMDLFSGSGALALESLSRGAKKAILCDSSNDAIKIIKKNIIKTHFEFQTEVFCMDYIQCLNKITEKLDIIFIDPPYEMNIAVNAVKAILNKNLLNKNGLIIIETDQQERELNQIKELNNIKIYDLRSYGRVKLIFLSKEENNIQ